jgi:hypothetical protein
MTRKCRSAYVPAAKPEKKQAAATTGIFGLPYEPIPSDNEDIRDPALSVDTDTVRVHVIESVSFEQTIIPSEDIDGQRTESRSFYEKYSVISLR